VSTLPILAGSSELPARVPFAFNLNGKNGEHSALATTYFAG
jgi:hypothetical protein